ncbi:AI-2E family transporter [Bacillus sp. N9]
METIADLFRNKGVKRIIIFALMVLFLYSVRSIINLILLTFIFAFLMDRLVEFTAKRIPINRRLLVLFLYTFIVGLLTFGLAKYLPIITTEISELFKRVNSFYSQPHDNVIINYIETILTNNQITTYLENGVSVLLKYFTDISKTSVQVLIALILSLFFLLEKPRLQEFTSKFKTSKISRSIMKLNFWKEIHKHVREGNRSTIHYCDRQLCVNCHCPNHHGLSTNLRLSDYDFFLGLIPVAGVIISLIPLTLIAYTIGGFIKVVYVLIAIAVIHAGEAYVLNPKLMSSKTDLPVFIRLSFSFFTALLRGLGTHHRDSCICFPT